MIVIYASDGRYSLRLDRSCLPLNVNTMKKIKLTKMVLWLSLLLLTLSLSVSCGIIRSNLSNTTKRSVEQMPFFPSEIMYERFEKNRVFLKKKGVRKIGKLRLIAYQVYKVTDKDGFIYKEPKQLTMYVEPEEKKVKYFCKNEQEDKEIIQLINPTVDSFGLEKKLGIKIREDLPDKGSFFVNGNKKIYFQRVGSAHIENLKLEGFAIVKAVNIVGESYLLSDILTLYVDPESTKIEYFSQLCDPCYDKPKKLSFETEYSIGLQTTIMQWRKENIDDDLL